MVYSYDNNGNLLSKSNTGGTTSYAWDHENRLTSVTLPGSEGIVNFQYDPFGRRIYKSSSSGTTTFVYDGPNVIEEIDATGSLMARYTHALGIDEPLAMLRGNTTSYYHTDGLGSVTSLSDSKGNLVSTYEYDSFGNLTSSTGSISNPFLYTGREFDAETGLYFYRARYYNPSIGRFISEDPIGFAGGINMYAYVGNNPGNYTDPEGLFWPIDCIKCFYYRNKLNKALKKCRDELKKCETFEDEAKFIEKYNGDGEGSALWNCSIEKLGDLEIWDKLSISCFKCGWMPTGPKPPAPGYPR